MDVLRPPLVYIGNRCYRKNPVVCATNTAEDDFEEEECGYRVADEYADESCAIDAIEDIESTAAGYQLKMQLPNVFFKYIIGKKGETKKRLESETRTQIKIPRQHEEGDIVIQGTDRSGVISARTRIDVIATSARRRLPFTHFLSLPIVSDVVQDRFDVFKEEVLQECDGERGIDGSIFQNRFKLHMTLGTMVLLDDAEITRAATLLQECQQDLVRSVLKNEPMTVCVGGLEYMNDDPSAVDVLYAKVSLTDGSNRLQMFADQLVERFVASGIMQHEYDRVKLHITVMNSLMRKDLSHAISSQGGQTSTRSGMRDRESFDAVQLMQLFGDFEFGEQHLDAVHISQRHSVSSDSYYLPAAVVDLP